MELNHILKNVEAKIGLDANELNDLKKQVSIFSESFSYALRKIDPKIKIFLGGSLAKGTVIRKKSKYDVDLFIIFPRNYSQKSSKISDLLEKALKMSKEKYQKLNGSRDYFQISKGKLVFELVPIIEIKKSDEAKNITDISPLHVKYLLNQIKGNHNLPREIMLAKAFCYAQGVYGAESYIQGFSGYSIEVLVSYFRSFKKMIDFFSKINLKKDKVIIDPKRYYKNKSELLLNINESKLISPIILVDPVDKTRNVSAALGIKRFNEFIHACKKLKNNPNESFFLFKEKNEEEFIKKARNKKAELIKLIVETNKNKLDVAGAKINKFLDLLSNSLEKNGFKIFEKENLFDEETLISKIYITLKNPEKMKIVRGPIKNCDKKFIFAFKKKYGNIFIQKGRYFAKTKNNFMNFASFFKSFMNQNKKVLKEMSIKKVTIPKV